MFFRGKRGRRPSGARNWVGKKKSEQKKKVRRRRRRVPPILYLVKLFTFLFEVFAFLSLFQPPKTFSYVFHFHNLSKRHSEKTIFWKKKTKKIIHFFFLIFFFSSFFFVQNLLDTFFFLFYCNSFSSNKKKRSKKRFARPVHFNLIFFFVLNFKIPFWNLEKINALKFLLFLIY